MKVILLYLFLFISVFFSEAAEKKNVLFLVGERFNSTSRTMPALASQLEKSLKVKTKYILVPKNGTAKGFEFIAKADLLIIYLHSRHLPKKQRDQINHYIESGKPVIAFHTSNRAFDNDASWFKKYFGGAFRGLVPGKSSHVTVNPHLKNHPILNELSGSSFVANRGVSLPGPLHTNAEVILMGKTASSPAFPVAWTFPYIKNQRIFYTSLGHPNDFRIKKFKTLLENAVSWCLKLNKPQPPNKDIEVTPPPPKLDAPEDAIILFSGQDMTQWKHWDLLQKPRSLNIDAKMEKFAGIVKSKKPLWKVNNEALVCRPGHGDIISKQTFGDYTLHLNFYIPKEPESVPNIFRGSGGVFVSGRYEVKIKESYLPLLNSTGAINMTTPAGREVSVEAGKWHTMKIDYKHENMAPAEISVTVNDVQLQNKTQVKTFTPYGIIDPLGKGNFKDQSLYSASVDVTAQKLKMTDNHFSVAARFKTSAVTGSLFGNISPSGWQRGSKALFIANGKILYDIGWQGTVFATKKVNDGNWHEVVLTQDGDMCIAYIDGKVSFMKKSFTGPDKKGNVFKVGFGFKNHFRNFDGQISNLRFYNRQITEKEVKLLYLNKVVPLDPTLDWKSKKKDLVTSTKESKEILKGPIRLHGDFSRIRYANIWVKEN